MADETFNPFNMNMPWDVDPSKTSATAEPAVEDKPNVEPAQEDAPVEPKQDIFTALEEKLRLPIGSTKEGIEETKQMVRKIQAKTAIFLPFRSLSRTKVRIGGVTFPAQTGKPMMMRSYFSTRNS